MKLTAWMIVLCLCFCGIVNQTAPAAAPDDSTPKAAAKSFYVALAAGDATAAQQVAIVADPWQEAFKTLIDYGVAFTRVSKAIEIKFGKDAANTMPSPGRRIEIMDASGEKIDGDSAVLTPSDGNDPLHLKRIDGHWKVDVFANPALHDPQAMTRAMQSMADAANKTADDTAAGKYNTLQELQKGLVDRIQQAIQPATAAPSAAPTTAPTTAPAAGPPTR